MKTTQKITQITHIAAYYPPHTGGLERVAKISAEELAKKGNFVHVLTSAISGIQRGTETKDNLCVSALWSFEFAHTPFAPTLLWHLLMLPRNSIIHLHLAHAYWPELVLLASKLRRIPYIAHFHLDVEPSGFFGPIFVLYKKIVWGPVLRNARRVIACSQDQAMVVERKFGVKKENIVVIANAVSEDFFTNKVYAPSTKQIRLLYVGRLALQKRVERLIEAVSKLSIPAHLTIVGDGEDRSKLEALVKKLKLSNVSFEGRKNDKEMQEYHRSHDAFLIASDKEGGTPLVVLEAMAGGLPILGTNVSGVRELLNDTGVLVNEPYAENFARTIEQLWRAPEKLIALSKKSSEKAKQYKWSRFIDQLEEVYGSISL
ncbi:MAG: glycosyltransferase family 4 protein [Patescibacteria group bacterium]